MPVSGRSRPASSASGSETTLSGLRSPLRIAALLAVIYLAAVALHLILLRDAFRFPHISSDEVQYAMTGENIRMGHGFMLRGQFNSTLPPVFPAFIALAHSADANDPRLAMFILSCFLMCASVFPAFAMARTIGLDDVPSLLLAASAGMLPHTLYAATYMSETAQYPAYLTAFWLCLRWLDKQTWFRDAATGGAMGVLLLTKLQGTQFVGAFLLTLIVIGIRARKSERRGAAVRHALTVLAVFGAIDGAWQLYKLAHGGTVLGAYSTVLAGQGLGLWTPQLALAYVADFLLAPGLITAVPLFLWIRHNGSFSRSVFVVAVFAVQILAVSTLDGGLTGWLRERLFLYAIPITAVLAASGIVWLKQRQTVLPGSALILFPVVMLMAVVLTHPFAISSVIEAPWAYAVGSLLGQVSFSRLCLVVVGAAISVVVAFTLLRSSDGAAPVLFGAFVLLFNIACFVSSSVAVAGWTARGMAELSPIVSWLAANGVHGGSRLLVAGRHAYFEDPSLARTDPEDDRFQDWTWRIGLEEALVWQIETVGRFDVRMIPAPAAVKNVGRPGDSVLSVARFDEMRLKSFHFPLCLYRIDAQLPSPPKAEYLLHVPAGQFHRGISRDLAFALPELPLGTYHLSIDTSQTTNQGITVDVAGLHGPLPQKRIGSSSAATAAFVNDALQPLSLLLHGPAPESTFEGVDLEFVSPSLRSVTTPAVVAPLQGEFSSVTPGGLGGVVSKTGTSCFVDRINDLPPALSVEVQRSEGLHLFGWAGAENMNPGAEQVYVELLSDSGAGYWAKAGRFPRPDVAQALNRPNWSNAGVSVSAGLGTVPAGRLSLKIILVEDGRPSECDTGRTVVLQ